VDALAPLALNLILLPLAAILAYRWAHAAGMQQRSGAELDKRYKRLFVTRGSNPRQPLPQLERVSRWTRIPWRYAYNRRDFRRWVRGPARVARAAQLAVVCAWAMSAETVDHDLLGVHTALAGGLLLAFEVFGRRFPVISPLLLSAIPGLGAVLWLTLAVFLATAPGNSEDAQAGAFTLVTVWSVWSLPAFALGSGKRSRMHARNLLVLRVFGSARRSGWLFHRLQPLWNLVGGVWTISSPDHASAALLALRPGKAKTALGVLAVGVSLGLQAALALREPEVAWQIAAAVLCNVALGAGIAALVRGSFVGSEDALYRKLMGSVGDRPGRRNRWGNVHQSAHDDNWKTTLEGMAGLADCVLIDVRGLTPERQGIAFELRFVVNHIPVDNVLLLADRTTDLDAVTKLIHAAWRKMPTKSPNRGGKRVIRVYQRRRLGPRDVERVAGWLMDGSQRLDLLGVDPETLKRF
jgi:hypothetical protein